MAKGNRGSIRLPAVGFPQGSGDPLMDPATDPVRQAAEKAAKSSKMLHDQLKKNQSTGLKP